LRIRAIATPTVRRRTTTKRSRSISILGGGFGSRGNALEAKGDFDGAIADCSETIRIDPRRIAGYRSRRLAYFYAADFGTAVSDSARTVEDKPADAYAAL
jgi:hypothetical protein